jgi:AmmeMemoRadiSam system protein A
MIDIYVQLAHDTIKLFLEKEELPDLKSVPMEILARRAGCFVSLHAKNGKLRGCIGTIRPNYKNLGGEIEANAIAASQHDPRFKPVRLDELSDLDINVDILSEPEQIFDEKDLDIKKYGVIVQASDGRDGLLLPDIDGIKNIKEQITIAREKAGILPDEEISLFRFTVERHK